jgi:hypothetical protein
VSERCFGGIRQKVKEYDKLTFIIGLHSLKVKMDASIFCVSVSVSVGLSPLLHTIMWKNECVLSRKKLKKQEILSLYYVTNHCVQKFLRIEDFLCCYFW